MDPSRSQSSEEERRSTAIESLRRATNGSAMSASPGMACSSALGLLELLEDILSFLPARTIFSVQRVAQSWKNTVTRSVAIQEKLSFRCQSKPQEVWKLHGRKHGLRAFRDFSNGRTYQYLPLNCSSGSHPVQLQHTEQVQDAIDLILPVALNPALEVPTSTSHHISIRQAPLGCPFLKVDDEGMFLHLPSGILAYEQYGLFQVVGWTGTMTALEHIAAM
jgi:hypothetical protein